MNCVTEESPDTYTVRFLSSRAIRHVIIRVGIWTHRKPVQVALTWSSMTEPRTVNPNMEDI